MKLKTSKNSIKNIAYIVPSFEESYTKCRHKCKIQGKRLALNLCTLATRKLLR